MTSSNSSSPILSTNKPSSQCQLALNEILDYSELETEYTSDDWDNYFTTQSPSLPIDGSEIAINAPEGEIDTVHNLLQANVLQSEIDDAAYILVRHTGLQGCELYRCSLATCNEKIDNLSSFEAHLRKHLKHKTSAMELKCYHCLGEDTAFTAENIDGLTRHIQSHGQIHRYFCYICAYTCAFEDKDHIRKKHEQKHSKTVALNPMKEDMNKDMFVLCGVAPFELDLFGRSLIEWSKEYSIPSNNSDHKQLQIPESQIEVRILM